MNNDSKFVFLVAAIAIFLLGYGLSILNKKPAEIKTETKWDTVYLKADTITKETYLQPIYITKSATIIKDTTRDTIKTLPFIAVDTTYTPRQDTIYTQYKFPENWFKHIVRFAPDTSKTIVKTVEIIKTIETKIEPTFWEKAEYVGIGGITGAAVTAVAIAIIKK